MKRDRVQVKVDYLGLLGGTLALCGVVLAVGMTLVLLVVMAQAVL